MRSICAILLAASAATAAPPDDALLFSFFRGNGEDGLYLAASDDGLAWRVLHGNRPLLRPAVGESKLMRDPSIARGPDGVFHMVWTTSWQGKTIGYASSRDLIEWTPQRTIPVMEHEPGAINSWAPEIFYDERENDFLVVWASTVRGRFPETQGAAGKEYNHRLYSFRTRDFKKIGPSKLFYDPGFPVIDAAIVRTAGGYAMVAKNETLEPPAKHLFTVFSRSSEGPWTKPSAPITGKDWAEGPAPVRFRGAWFLYFDLYRNRRYGALRSADFKTWEDVTGRLRFPEGARHGTAFVVPRAVAERLR